MVWHFFDCNICYAFHRGLTIELHGASVRLISAAAHLIIFIRRVDQLGALHLSKADEPLKHATSTIVDSDSLIALGPWILDELCWA